MRSVRILHCGKSVKNYYICMSSKIVGFTQRFSNGGTGDRIYIAVNSNGKSVCGARAILGEPVEQKPEWENGERLIKCYRIKDIEFCEFFDLSILKKVDKNWGAKFVLSSKPIIVKKAINLLDKKFNDLKCDELDLSLISTIAVTESEQEESNEEELVNLKDEKVDLLGTFETIRFRNETDLNKGLEHLVNQNFYNLFESIPENKSILIPYNRLFITQGVKGSNNKIVPGTKTIPDGLLITFNEGNNKPYLMINLIEYECYGEGKVRESQKEAYLGGVILKQLMKFAATFSITTDFQSRQETIEDWIIKIMSYINSDELLNDKINQWIKCIHPNIKESAIDRRFEQYLKKAFRYNLRIMLVIDEITVEQKKLIENVIHSYPLEQYEGSLKANFIQFRCYVVKLHQVFKVFDLNAKYALSLQEY
ncbi:MAG: hypothetical protein ACLRZR_01325 [Turicibacter sp.]